jgi:hypothetical protein
VIVSSNVGCTLCTSDAKSLWCIECTLPAALIPNYAPWPLSQKPRTISLTDISMTEKSRSRLLARQDFIFQTLRMKLLFY